MDNSKTISTVIKTSIAILFAIFFVLLLSQYISIAQLNAKNDSLNNELQSATQELENYNQEHDNIANNYESFVEDYVRENFEYGYEGETSFNSQN